MIWIPLPGTPQLSVVLAVHDGEATLLPALEALTASDLPRRDWELIVVDDASMDASAAVAARFADLVVRLPERPRGPAYARNRGIELARAPILAFVNADVAVHEDTLRRLCRVLENEPSVAAAFAVDDDRAPAGGFVSQYWNLLGHVNCTDAAPRAGMLWVGCVAIRREALNVVGTFDEWRFGTGPSAGAELAQRFRDRGYRVHIASGAAVTRLRQWSIRSVTSDVWRRTVLVARIIGPRAALSERRPMVLSVLSRPEMLLAVAGVLALVVFAPPLGPRWPLALSLAVGLWVSVHRRLCLLFLRYRGLRFLLRAIPLHFSLEVLSAAALTHGWLLRQLLGDPHPDPTTQAYAEVGVRMWPPVPQRR